MQDVRNPEDFVGRSIARFEDAALLTLSLITTSDPTRPTKTRNAALCLKKKNTMMTDALPCHRYHTCDLHLHALI